MTTDPAMPHRIGEVTLTVLGPDARPLDERVVTVRHNDPTNRSRVAVLWAAERRLRAVSDGCGR